MRLHLPLHRVIAIFISVFLRDVPLSSLLGVKSAEEMMLLSNENDSETEAELLESIENSSEKSLLKHTLLPNVASRNVSDTSSSSEYQSDSNAKTVSSQLLLFRPQRLIEAPIALQVWCGEVAAGIWIEWGIRMMNLETKYATVNTKHKDWDFFLIQVGMLLVCEFYMVFNSFV